MPHLAGLSSVGGTSVTIRVRKDAIRADALARRESVSPMLRQAFVSSLARSGLELVQRIGGASPVVSVFLPIRGEPDTVPLLAALADAGIATCLPATPPRGEPLRFRLWRVGDPLAPGRFATAEPAGDAPEVDPDLLFVPLAAFDARGFRLGYGAGYYDHVLGRLRACKPIHAVGVAFAVQEVGRVPAEPHDQSLDALLTEAGPMTFGSP